MIGSSGEAMSKDEYIFARIDVVAFTKLSNPDLKIGVFDAIRKIVLDLNGEIRRSVVSRNNKKLKLEGARYYGDTIDIYFRAGDLDALILILFDVVAKAQRMALREGFFIKGAIVKGDLHVTKDGSTGMAMVTASEVEGACEYPCVTVDKGVVEIFDTAVREQFRTESDFSDYRKKMITYDPVTEKYYLNYVEACQLNSPEYAPELSAHRISLIATVERYVRILPNDTKKCVAHITMYEYALKNHNNICALYNAPEEVITFVAERKGKFGIRFE